MPKIFSTISCQLLLAILLFVPQAAFAASPGTGPIDLTASWVGILAIGVFVLAYVFVVLEEKLHMRKSKPVMIAAGLIWMIIGAYYAFNHSELSTSVGPAVQKNLLEYAELFLFLLVAMTYINAMDERKLFDALRAYLVRSGLRLRTLFWITGALAFVISPIADNLTTALLMCAVVMKVGEGNKNFIGIACINIVVAANAGGAFSPFGDITTLMVWQKGVVEFTEFFVLFVPSVVNFIVPALIMQFFISNDAPKVSNEVIYTERGAKRVVLLFLFTISMAVIGHSMFHLPPVLGMMTGFGLLQLFGYYLKSSFNKDLDHKRQFAAKSHSRDVLKNIQLTRPFDVFSRTALAEWDTLLFFYGVVMCVGGLGFLGYLAIVSELMYMRLDHTVANTLVGLLSALIDNIPVMFAVLSMEPDMSHGQWLLVTLTAGVGGSLLSIGSAAGVALMGQARGYYTFFGHIKWMPVIMLGYIGSIATHLWLNKSLFSIPAVL